MSVGPSVTVQVDFATGPKGRRRIVVEPRKGDRATAAPPGRLPRITRLLALAIRIEDLIQRGELRDYAEAARAGGVTPARMSQIASLTLLAPQIQDDILHMPRVERGRDVITERGLRAIAGEPDWGRQFSRWQRVDKPVGCAPLTLPSATTSGSSRARG